MSLKCFLLAPLLLEWFDDNYRYLLWQSIGMNDPKMASSIHKPIVSLLMTGSDTIDTNSAFLSRTLLDIGLQVNEITTVGDDYHQLTDQLHRLTAKSQLLLVNGGLGPTQDDLTAQVLAKIAGTPLATNAEAKSHILNWCLVRGFHANEANLKQAELPLGCHIFPDAPGSAPAFYLMVDQCLVIATPGVPSELKDITWNHLLPFLQQHFSTARTVHWRKLQLLGIGESKLQELLHKQCIGIDQFIELGFRARFPTLELKYRPAPEIQESSPDFIHWEQKLLELIQTYLLGKGDVTPAGLLVELLCQQCKTVTSAESCTGGLIASEITRIPGASAVFPGSIVSYSNTIKSNILHVPPEILDIHGAVSQQTVSFMLKGALEIMQTDIGIAISGIAGPQGGSKEKPVGTVWIAWGDHQHQQTLHLYIPLERQMFQNLLSTICLDLLRRWALGETSIPAYLKRWQP